MAFGIKKGEPDTVREPNEDSVIGEYPGFVPPLYHRPGVPVVEKLDDPSQVDNNTDRGTESHGLKVDSHVHPKDAKTEDHDLDASPVAEIYPQFEDDCPVPVRVVNDAGRHRVVTVIQQVAVSFTGSSSRLLPEDPYRVRALVSSTTGLERIFNEPGDLATYGFPIPPVTAAGALELTTDQELWVGNIVSEELTADTVVNVLIERRLPLDLPDSATLK